MDSKRSERTQALMTDWCHRKNHEHQWQRSPTGLLIVDTCYQLRYETKRKNKNQQTKEVKSSETKHVQQSNETFFRGTEQSNLPRLPIQTKNPSRCNTTGAWADHPWRPATAVEGVHEEEITKGKLPTVHGTVGEEQQPIKQQNKTKQNWKRASHKASMDSNKKGGMTIRQNFK